MIFNNKFLFYSRVLNEIINNFPVEQEENSILNSSCRKFSGLFVKLWYECAPNLKDTRHQKFVDSKAYAYLKQLLKLASNTTFYQIVLSVSDMIKSNEKLLQTNRFYDDDDFISGLLDLNDLLVNYKKSYEQDKANNLLNNSKNSTGLLKDQLIEFIHSKCAAYFSSEHFKAGYLNPSLFTFADYELYKKRLNSMHRVSIHNCLSETANYIKVNCNVPLEIEDTPRKRSKNQSVGLVTFKNECSLVLSMVYKIFLECGHMINLYDWLQAFAEKLENKDIEEMNESKRSVLL